MRFIKGFYKLRLKENQIDEEATKKSPEERNKVEERLDERIYDMNRLVS